MHWHGGSTRVGKAPSYSGIHPRRDSEVWCYPFLLPAGPRGHGVVPTGTPRYPRRPPGKSPENAKFPPPRKTGFSAPREISPARGGAPGGPPRGPPRTPQNGLFWDLCFIFFCALSICFPPYPQNTPKNPQKWPKKRVLLLSRLGELLNTQKNVHSRGVFPGFPSPGNPYPLGVSLGRPPNLARGARFSTTRVSVPRQVL